MISRVLPTSLSLFSSGVQAVSFVTEPPREEVARDPLACFGAGDFNEDEWPYCQVLQEGTLLYHAQTSDGDFVKIGLHVENHDGWSAVALAGNGGMKGASFIVVRRDDSGSWVAEDRYALDYTTPSLDAQQDVSLIWAGEISGGTAWAVLIPMASCDVDDEIIDDNLRPMIWALGSGHSFSYHGSNRGQFHANLVSGPPAVVEMPDGVLEVDLTMPDVPIVIGHGGTSPTNPYKCAFFDLQDLLPNHDFTQTKHAIRLSPKLSPDTAAYCHHMLLSVCRNTASGASVLPNNHRHGDFLDNCEQMPAESISDYEQITCEESVWAWAVGSGDMVFPAGVGMPFDQTNRFLALQMHYYNPSLHEGLVDRSGIQVSFSPTPRAVDVGMLFINGGSEEGNRPLGLEPGQPSLTPSALVIPSDCTSEWSQESITLLSVNHHMHLLGIQMNAHVSRNGEYVGPLRRERYFDFNHQAFEQGPVTTLHRGDQIVFTCTFDTSGRTQQTSFSDFTDTEMCMAFVMYYPKLTPAQEYFEVVNDLIPLGLLGESGDSTHATFCNNDVTMLLPDLSIAPSACMPRGDLTSASATAITSAGRPDAVTDSGGGDGSSAGGGGGATQDRNAGGATNSEAEVAASAAEDGHDRPATGLAAACAIAMLAGAV